MLDAHPVQTPPDAALGPLRCPLQGEAGLDALDGALDGRGNPLDAALDGAPEHRDVALPPRRPLAGLLGETLLGTGGHQVERSEEGDAGGAHGENLGPRRGGDAERHVGGMDVIELMSVSR